MIKHLRIARAFLRISWMNSIEYMNDFAVICVDFIVTMIATILFWKYLLVDFQSLGKWQVAGLVLIGIFGNASWAIGEVFAGAWGLSEKITSGQLDKYLCRPVNAIYALVLEDMQLEELLKGVISLVALLIWHGVTFQDEINAINLLLAIISMLVGIVIVALVRCIYSCFAFWFPNTEGLNMLIHMEDLQIDRYPLGIFNKPTRLLLISIIPVGFIACIPAMLYMNMIAKPLMCLAFEIAIMMIMLFVLHIMWKGGIRKYEATGG